MKCHRSDGSCLPRGYRAFVVLLICAGLLVLSACTGEHEDDADARVNQPGQGLTFTYPFPGQTDVPLDTQMVIRFERDVGDVSTDALELRYRTHDDETGTQALTVREDGGQDPSTGVLCLAPGSNVAPQSGNDFCLQRSEPLIPNAAYQVVATQQISDGLTVFTQGDVLYEFKTQPQDGRPAGEDFAVEQLWPGDNSFQTVSDQTSTTSDLFTVLNAIRVVLNEPVDPATVTPDSFIVTRNDDDSTIEGALTALGRYIVFDPTNDLEPGDYTIELTSDIESAFGDSLDGQSFDRTVLGIGESTDQTLTIERDATGTDVSGLPTSTLNGLATNNVNLRSQLIGTNNLPTLSPDDVVQGADQISRGLNTTLAEPGLPGYGDVIPAVIRNGQDFEVAGLRLELGGRVLVPQISPSGPISVNFINDASVYLSANPLRNIETPTFARLRFDLGLGSLINAIQDSEIGNQIAANSVINQSALNIQAAGLVFPRENGDLEISVLGTFPIKINRTDEATVNFTLTLVLPAAPEDQLDLNEDTTPPRLTARAPSACLYVFGNVGPGSVIDAGSTEASCQSAAEVDSYPIEASPALTFNEPLATQSVDSGSVQLFAANNGVATNNAIPASTRVEGFTIVVDPDQALQPGQEYVIRVNSGVTDLAGNALSSTESIRFTTEPVVSATVSNSPATPAFLGSLTPGLPCALRGTNFSANQAGNCVGGNDTGIVPFPVFGHPLNVPVEAFTTKLVRRDSIVMANGCLTQGSGDSNDQDDASVALQRMTDDGQCLGIVPGELSFTNANSSGTVNDESGVFTRGFSYRPVDFLDEGERYAFVICGDESDACVNNAGTIVDIDGFSLNTDPLNGTGGLDSDDNDTGVTAQGGPDIVMPFDATAFTRDYYATQFTLPAADTNDNGQFDPGENRQPGNLGLVALAAQLGPVDFDIENLDVDDNAQFDTKFPSYLSEPRPVIIRDGTTDCDDATATVDNNGNSIVGDIDECVPVDLLPGGFTALTAVNLTGNELATAVDGIPGIGELLETLGSPLLQLLLGFPPTETAISTGRILLRYPGVEQTTGVANQTGHIVESCPNPFTASNSDSFSPCFVASLRLVANAPDTRSLNFEQQAITANVVGPVRFLRNGRLAISVRNTSDITLNAGADFELLVLPALATIEAGDLTLQLTGNVPHGGLAFPTR